MIGKVGKRCVACGACIARCPTQCLSLETDDAGFKYPTVDKDKCINCNLCDKACPILSNKSNSNQSKKVFAVQSCDNAVLEKSSSGGAFYLLASEIVKKGGYVCGVEISNDNKVRHSIVDNLKDLDKFLGSKYVQSDIGNTYLEVKKLLDNGAQVLFSGTPCQVNGLKIFLNKEYENLLTVDLICHGVPSPYVWEKYLEFQEKKHGSKIVSVKFREKRINWINSGIELKFSNGDTYFEVMKNDAFFLHFLKNFCLRESCYACEFKGDNRFSDITIGDFWGVDRLYPELYNDKGVSLAILNTDKGVYTFENNPYLKNCLEVNLDKALKYNEAYWLPVEGFKYRNAFVKELRKKPFDKVTRKYLRKLATRQRLYSYFNKIKRIITNKKK